MNRSSENSLIRVACEPGSSILEAVHQFAVTYTHARFRSSIADQISVAAYELLANGLSYGSVTCDVVFELRQSEQALVVVVSNRTIPSRLRVLTTHAARLVENPELVYTEEIRRSLDGGGLKPMLGLARIAHEAGMTLDVSSTDGAVALVSASCRA